ncbi:dihydroorotate dehydrogenase [Rhabdothermincola sp.]|uniref:dihydroorotate dehydrogenase n=1 Tax=Rhabdothermincola sp. TaxID=2820405 RepID=UPI002FDF5D79
MSLPGWRRRAPSGREAGARSVDLSTTVGSVALPNPVMTASGTAGHGDELASYVDLATLGAVVVKSLSADPWRGNPPPRVHETTAGMINSVGLQGPGVAQWLACELPALLATGANVVASIWGRTVEDYAAAAEALAYAPPEVVAVEVNLSCPNLHSHPGGAPPAGTEMFAQSASAAAAAVRASGACGRPRWAKLTANVTSLVPIAAAVREAGAEAVTLINTLPAMSIDPETRRPRLGGGGGGLSGPAIHPVAVRAVYDVHAAMPDLPIVGVGGVATGTDAVELLLAGASAVQVGTSTFADPRAPGSVLAELAAWCQQHGVRAVRELIGGAHGS